MPNKEILQQSLIPKEDYCEIWNEFLNLSAKNNLYWSQEYILRNPNFHAKNPIYISTQNNMIEELYNAFHNLNKWYNSDIWSFKIIEICELKLSGDLNESFLREVALAVRNNDQDEIDRLGRQRANKKQNKKSILQGPTYEDVVDGLRNQKQGFTEFIGRHFITKVELYKNNRSGGVTNTNNANKSEGNDIENDDSSGNTVINPPVYILFSFVKKEYFQSEFINGQGFTCHIV